MSTKADGLTSPYFTEKTPNQASKKVVAKKLSMSTAVSESKVVLKKSKTSQSRELVPDEIKEESDTDNKSNVQNLTSKSKKKEVVLNTKSNRSRNKDIKVESKMDIESNTSKSESKITPKSKTKSVDRSVKEKDKSESKGKFSNSMRKRKKIDYKEVHTEDSGDDAAEKSEDLKKGRKKIKEEITSDEEFEATNSRRNSSNKKQNCPLKPTLDDLGSPTRSSELLLKVSDESDFEKSSKPLKKSGGSAKKSKKVISPDSTDDEYVLPTPGGGSGGSKSSGKKSKIEDGR